MLPLKRNQVIITALVVMIGVAGYLNYIDSSTITHEEVLLTDDDGNAILVDDSGAAGDLVMVEQEAVAEVELADSEASVSVESDEIKSAEAQIDAEGAGEAVFVNSTPDSSYFVQAKLDREQARAKQKDILTDVINNNNVDSEKKTDATNAMLEIQKRIERETACEAMIEAKGFTEAYVRIDDNTVDVVVDKAELSEQEIAQIEDIVKRKTGVSADKIRITPIKK